MPPVGESYTQEMNAHYYQLFDSIHERHNMQDHVRWIATQWLTTTLDCDAVTTTHSLPYASWNWPISYGVNIEWQNAWKKLIMGNCKFGMMPLLTTFISVVQRVTKVSPHTFTSPCWKRLNLSQTYLALMKPVSTLKYPTILSYIVYLWACYTCMIFVHIPLLFNATSRIISISNPDLWIPIPFGPLNLLLGHRMWGVWEPIL